MRSIWKIKEKNHSLVNSLSKELNIHQVISHLLINRGIREVSDAAKFLNPKLQDLYDPFLLKGMDKAVQRIKKALSNKEKIVIFGDYDVDGICACVLLVLVLRDLGIDAHYYLPHRINEGYGISPAGIDFAKIKKATLAISVDCGISNFEEVKSLARNGIDVIVTDHHQPHKGLIPKEALAVINPKQEGCFYPDKDIAGVGVAFKLACALTGKVIEEHLDLVCLGTIADVVPLLNENRIFVKKGLAVINATKKIGLRELIKSASIKGEVTPFVVGFVLGPRINAAGRMSSADLAARLFLTENIQEAQELAKSLCDQNRARQKVEEGILAKAYFEVEKNFDFNKDHVIVLDDNDWHAGVLGIVASRVSDRFKRPTVAISWDGELGKGSARSIQNFHIFDALTHCETLLQGYGGHKHAAGLSILKGNIHSFRALINAFARGKLAKEDLLPVFEIDAELAISTFDNELILSLESLAPFGNGNAHPIFCSRGLAVKPGAAVLGRDTLRFWVSDGTVTTKAIGFRKAEFCPLVKSAQEVDLVYTPTLDTWQGNDGFQLEFKDLKVTDRFFADQPS